MEKFKQLCSKRWNQIKWFILEIGKTFSDKIRSVFSSKRINQWFSFCTGQAFMIVFFIEHHQTMTYLECLALAGAEFTIAGYALSHVQKEKKLEKPTENVEELP